VVPQNDYDAIGCSPLVCCQKYQTMEGFQGNQEQDDDEGPEKGV
jgi:hypothetical protein